MTSLHLKSRLRIAALALGVGCLVLYLSRTTTGLKQFDASLVMVALSYQLGEQFVHQVDPDASTITIGSLNKNQGQKSHVQTVQITDDPEQIFEQCPPSALDYAIILTAMHNRGYRDVILTTSMNWDQQIGLETQGLGRQLGMFEYSAIALPVTRVATPQQLPDILRRSLIPMSQVSGNHRQLPLINYAPIPVKADGGKHTLAGFSEVESIPAAEGRISMLAHWEGQGLIPSIDLVTVMMAHRISPSDIRVDCGNHIRLGKNGPIIPIDPFGQTPIPDKPDQILTPVPAEKLITPVDKDDEASRLTQPSPIAVIHASGEKTTATNTLSADRLSGLISLSHSYPVPDERTPYPRLPAWASVILLLDIAFLSLWFGALTRSKRQLAYILTVVLLVPLLFGLLAALLYFTNHWLSLSAPLATLLTAWILHVVSLRNKRWPGKALKNPDTAQQAVQHQA